MHVRLALAALLLAFVSAGQPANSTTEAPSVLKDARATPRGTLLGYLDACRREDYRRAASFLSYRSQHRRLGSPEELAQQLKQVLDRDLTRDPARFSDAPEGDRTDGLEPNLELLATVQRDDRKVDLLMEREEVPDIGEIWLISSDTISMIPVLHAQLDVNPVEKYLPSWLLQKTAFDTRLWQWFALLLLTMLALMAGHVLARVLVLFLRRVVRRTSTELDDHLIDAMRRPVQLFVALLAYRAGIVWVAPSYLLRTLLTRTLTSVVYFAIAWVIVRFIDVAATKILTSMSGHQKASVASIMPLARRTLKALAIVGAVLATLASWGYDTTALLAGLGVGGLAVALAAQKTIENLFGGVAITSDKPVQVGDFCKYGSSSGTVEDIGLRSTRIRTVDRTIVTVPNAEFSSLQIENFGKRDKISFRPVLQLSRETTPAQLRVLLPQIQALLAEHPKVEEKSRVRFIAIGSWSLDVEIFSYVLTSDFNEFLQIQEGLLIRILDLVEQAGTSLAVPTQLTMLGRTGQDGNQPALTKA